MLFQLSGHGHPQDDATTNFFADSKGPILGLLNEVSFVPEFSGKMVKIKETSFLLTDNDSELHLDFDQKKFDPHILHPKQL